MARYKETPRDLLTTAKQGSPHVPQLTREHSMNQLQKKRRACCTHNPSYRTAATIHLIDEALTALAPTLSVALQVP